MAQKLSIKDYYDRINKKFSIDSEFDENYDYFELYKRYSKKSRKMIENIVNLKPNTTERLVEILDKLDNLGRGVTLKKMIFVYGLDKGKELFDSYRNKQALTNSLAYKKEKYGWTEVDFKTFNVSRGVTLKNLQKKHGLIDGKIKFENYCERQAYTNSEEHLGAEKFRRINRQKAHTFDTYLERYGSEEEALKNLNRFYANSKIFFSKISQELFWKLDKTGIFGKSYFAELNGEYGVYSHSQNRYYKYDFVSIDKKICIEFHGDHYHGNPDFYNPNDFMRGRGQSKITAMDAWKRDEIKAKSLKEERNFETIIVWESDYRTNKEKTIDRILKYANNVQ